MKSVRAISRYRMPNSDIRSDDYDDNLKQTLGNSLLSPTTLKDKSQVRVSHKSGFGSIGKSGRTKEIMTGYPFLKDNQSEITEEKSGPFVFKSKNPKQYDEFIDMVHIQNEAFSKMFVESLEQTTSPHFRAKSLMGKGFKKSTYPRAKIPMELKEKFDMISDNFNYNDEFWRPEFIEKVILGFIIYDIGERKRPRSKSNYN